VQVGREAITGHTLRICMSMLLRRETPVLLPDAWLRLLSCRYGTRHVKVDDVMTTTLRLVLHASFRLKPGPQQSCTCDARAHRTTDT